MALTKLQQQSSSLRRPPDNAFASLSFAPLSKCGLQAEDGAAARLKAVEHPSAEQLWKHPLAALSYLPKDAALFLAGAFAGVAAKTVTAPLDRIKLSMQVSNPFSSMSGLYAFLNEEVRMHQ
jgi:hypothetical protein